MNFRISDTFTTSLSKLAGDEQKSVKTTVVDLQINPKQPSLRWHKLDRCKDKHFVSVSASMDLRIIVHQTEESLLLCYVDHHDAAYRWAERRKIEIHPKTGAAQLVQVRERVQEIVVPTYVTGEATETVASVKKAKREPQRPFAKFTDDALLEYGVPAEWLADVKQVDEDKLLGLVEHLPAEAAEALLELATGGTPEKPAVVTSAAKDPFEHPDAQRRFRVMSNVEELERALEYPWEKWMVFLHPAQRAMVTKAFNGPARVSGSAGTGKTIVALHRAVWLAEKEENARVLLTTFSKPLAMALQARLRRLIYRKPMLGERIDVVEIAEVGRRLARCKQPVGGKQALWPIFVAASKHSGEARFTPAFLWSEWSTIVDAWQITSWEDYKKVKRLGRKTRLAEPQRQKLWEIFAEIRSEMEAKGLVSEAARFCMAAENAAASNHPPFEHVVVDEAQDVSVPQLRMLAAIGGNRADSLFFAGDLGQRIFQQPFSWKALGIDIRGRSSTLRINYRTSHQIRQQADLLLPQELSDVDGNKENRKGTVSVFNGPPPFLREFDDAAEEATAIGTWIAEAAGDGILPHEIGVIVRSDAELPRAREAAEAAGMEAFELDGSTDMKTGCVSIGTMHLAKGLEFRAVAVMACDDEVIPSQERIDTVSDVSDLEEVYNTERHLLYVACTRARDRLMVSGVEPASEFLEDLLS